MAGKKQNYGPQFPLRNFAIKGAGDRISAHRFAEDKHRAATSIKDQAHENNFYGNADTEEHLSKLEGAAADLIKRAIVIE